ncbi:MAG: hypothetical protein U5J96_12440 [Ignavibacteriaceae bacterium]|nr:hypothetical protein [Ignavibacteriaceae bacterium]
MYRSTDNGENWTYLNDHHVRSIAVSGSTVFEGTEYQGVYRSNSNGETWTETRAE